MLELHPQILEKQGKREFIVLPYEEFLALQQILADAQDLIDLREAKNAEQHAPTMELNEVKKLPVISILRTATLACCRVV